MGMHSNVFEGNKWSDGSVPRSDLGANISKLIDAGQQSGSWKDVNLNFISHICLYLTLIYQLTSTNTSNSNLTDHQDDDQRSYCNEHLR